MALTKIPRVAVALPALLIGGALALPLATGAIADDVPELNIQPTCRGIAEQAAAPSEKGGPDLAYSQCMQSERAMKERLVGEWPTFVANDKTNCVAEATSTSLPSYTDLATCLEMARDARTLSAPAGPYRIER